jgi:hypothetical protein
VCRAPGFLTIPQQKAAARRGCRISAIYRGLAPSNAKQIVRKALRFIARLFSLEILMPELSCQGKMFV